MISSLVFWAALLCLLLNSALVVFLWNGMRWHVFTMNAMSDKMFLCNDNNKENHVCLFHLNQLSIVIANDSKRILPTNGIVPCIHPFSTWVVFVQFEQWNAYLRTMKKIATERTNERDKELKWWANDGYGDGDGVSDRNQIVTISFVDLIIINICGDTIERASCTFRYRCAIMCCPVAICSLTNWQLNKTRIKAEL